MTAHDEAPARWAMSGAGGPCILRLEGDWLARRGALPGFPKDGLVGCGADVSLQFDIAGLGHWDSGLIAFLWDVKRAAISAGRTVDAAGLPLAATKLLGLLPDQAMAQEAVVVHHIGPLNWLGGQTLATLHEMGMISRLSGSTARAGWQFTRGRGLMRGTDLWANILDAGPQALIIVSIVNFLIGAILAFVGAVELRKFSADIYVANLVGLAVVREMAAVMTAIVMAGRTGGAYAARIATMQGNEEIDALSVIGISSTGYIVLPAVLAMMLMMPLLYLYGSLIGVFGGFVVAISMLNVTAPGYWNETVNALAFSQFGLGVTKSVAFAFLIGVSSCRIGLRAGRSSADVGVAATRAVVAGIVGVIALDAVFAVVAETFGI